MKFTPLLLLLVCLNCFSSMQANNKIIIILNNNLASESISLKEMKKWRKGKIKPCSLKRGEVHKSFLKIYMNKSPQQYSSFWRKIIFTGKGAPPKAFRTEEEIVKYVANNEGAIGYISTSTAHENVTVLKL